MYYANFNPEILFIHYKCTYKRNWKVRFSYPYCDITVTNISFSCLHNVTGRCSGRDLMVVVFTPTYAIFAYHHRCREFDSCLGRGEQYYVIKFVNHLRQVGGFLRVLRFPPIIKLTAKI